MTTWIHRSSTSEDELDAAKGAGLKDEEGGSKTVEGEGLRWKKGRD